MFDVHLSKQFLMKSPRPSETYRPFENLKALLGENAFPSASGTEKEHVAKDDHDTSLNADEEKGLFQKAMSDVVPIARDIGPTHRVRAIGSSVPKYDPEAEALTSLEDLIREGDGFVISDTPEYMEGVGYGVNPEIAKRLHLGDFSIQAHLDLHGLGVGDASEAFEQFLKKALLSGKRSVLIIHGRGLSSRGEPVLKTKVREWLTSGHWRKWVIAFTSARACDGGTGATYVLLRQRPATKRYRKGAAKK